MLTFAETQSNAAMKAAIGRRLLALIRPGVVDFASGGGKKCTKGLSCGGSCISKAKVCIKAMNPAQKKQYGAIVKAAKAGGVEAKAQIGKIKSEQQSTTEAPKKAVVVPEVKVEPKVEAKPTKAGDAKKLSDSDLSAAEKSRFGKRIETLDRIMMPTIARESPSILDVAGHLPGSLRVLDLVFCQCLKQVAD